MKKLTMPTVILRLREYLAMALAGVLNALSIYTFLNPSHLIAGGFSGLSSALTYILNLFIPSVGYDSLMSAVYFVINIPLLICSVIMLRGDFTFKTVFATLVCTATLAVLPKALPAFKFDESPIIAVLLGGVMIGLSMYVASEHNGSNGGTEIIARLVNKYHPEVDLSRVILLANLAVAITGSVIVMVIKHESVSVVIYSLIYISVGSVVMGALKRGFNHPQKFMIVTTEYETLASDITKYFRRGCTCIDLDVPQGGKPRKLVMVVVQYRQRVYLKQLIKARDSEAFTFVKDVNDVFSRPTFNRSYKTK